MIKISAVSYTNTKPFIYGLTHNKINEQINLILDNPSNCAQKLVNQEVDIGLIPVATLFQNPDFQIISNYCIGAHGPVHSVFIFSYKPIDQIKTLKKDKQSRTSNLLAEILLKNYWKNTPIFTESEDVDAFVQIGDRTFGKKKDYPYAYDLAEEWLKFSGLPFVFAVWATNKKLDPDFILNFNKALQFGLNNRSKVLLELPQQTNFNLTDYLMNQIDYIFDAQKQQALEKFFSLIKSN